MSFWKWIWQKLNPAPIPVTSDLLVCMNRYRAQAGLKPFIEDARLNLSATSHCRIMVGTNTFSHQCPGEASFDQRIKSAGYLWGSYVSECIAAGQSTAAQAVDDWMSEVPPNDGHRKSVLGPAVNAGCGLAVANGTQWTYYWTADFASP